MNNLYKYGKTLSMLTAIIIMVTACANSNPSSKVSSSQSMSSYHDGKTSSDDIKFDLARKKSVSPYYFGPSYAVKVHPVTGAFIEAFAKENQGFQELTNEKQALLLATKQQIKDLNVFLVEIRSADVKVLDLSKWNISLTQDSKKYPGSFSTPNKKVKELDPRDKSSSYIYVYFLRDLVTFKDAKIDPNKPFSVSIQLVDAKKAYDPIVLSWLQNDQT